MLVCQLLATISRQPASLTGESHDCVLRITFSACVHDSIVHLQRATWQLSTHVPMPLEQLQHRCWYTVYDTELLMQGCKCLIAIETAKLFTKPPPDSAYWN